MDPVSLKDERRGQDREVASVVSLTRLNGGELVLNADLIVTVEEFHDTVVTLVDGRCVVVAESAADVVAAVVRYRASVLALAERITPDVPYTPDLSRAATVGTGSARVLTLRPAPSEA
jgi:flagellar protein FlbD